MTAQPVRNLSGPYTSLQLRVAVVLDRPSLAWPTTSRPSTDRVRTLPASAFGTGDVELAELPPSALDHSPRNRTPPSLRSISPNHARRLEKLLCLLDDEMKFSHSVQFNAVPEWSSHYISYSNLKKLIYQLEKQSNSKNAARRGSTLDPESSPLILYGSHNLDDPDAIFSRKLDEELDKICSFYQVKEQELTDEVETLMKDVEEFVAEQEAGEVEGEGGRTRRSSVWARARRQSIFRSFSLPLRRQPSSSGSREAAIPEEDDSVDDDDENSNLTKSFNTGPPLDRSQTPETSRSMGRGRDFVRGESIDQSEDAPSLRRRHSTAFHDFGDEALQALYDEGITLKKRTINLYVNICELRSFLQLNQTGFRKVLKKYDKTLDRNLKSQYLEASVKPAYPFQPSTLDHLTGNLTRVEEAYASIVTKGDTSAARTELRLHLREHVVWERNTVWREMIGIERKAQAANLGIRNTMLGQETDPKKARLQGDDDESMTKEIITPLGTTRCPRLILSVTFWVLVCSIAVFAVLLSLPIMEKREEQNCLALVVFVSLLWSTEVTSSSSSPLI